MNDTKGKAMRLFLAIEPNPEIKNMLATIQGLLKDNFLSAKIVPYEMMHCTLIYFGEKNDTEYQEIDHVISMIDFSGFKLELDQVDFFTKKNKHVCYCAIKENQVLHDLYNKLKQSFLDQGIFFDNRNFKAHITLAKNVRLKDNQPIVLPYVPKSSFLVSSIVLYQSHQVKGQLTYTPLIRYGIKKDAD